MSTSHRILASRPLLTPRGPVRSADAIYIRRPADEELFKNLLDGVFSYVLGPRQIGKTSLRMRVTELLIQHNRRCAAVDLTLIGQAGVKQDDWYFSLMSDIARELNLPDPLAAWEQNSHLTVVDRWGKFLESAVSGSDERPVVIFIDEIDNLLGFDFRTDFFASLRGINQVSDRTLPYGRLTFCVLGVALPLQLCPDPARTPFNIGREIHLHDFTPDQAEAFVTPLRSGTDNAEALLKQIMDWTQGHPAMTQRLCDALLTDWEQPMTKLPRPDSELQGELDALVKRVFVQDALTKDPILAEINHRFADRLGFLDVKDSKTCLALYKDILIRQEGIGLQYSSSPHLWLQLFGLCAVREKAGVRSLIVRNRIVAEVFDIDWVQAVAQRLQLDARILAWRDAPSNTSLLAQGPELLSAQHRAAANELNRDELMHLRASEAAERRQVRQRRRLQLWRFALTTLFGVATLAIVLVLLRTSKSEKLQGELDQYRTKVAELAEQLAKISLPAFANDQDLAIICKLDPKERREAIAEYEKAQKARHDQIASFQRDLQVAQGMVSRSLGQAEEISIQLKAKSLVLLNSGQLQKQVDEIKKSLTLSSQSVSALERRIDDLQPKPFRPDNSAVSAESLGSKPAKTSSPPPEPVAPRLFDRAGQRLDSILHQAEDLYVNEKYQEAISIADQSKDKRNAWHLKGACGCYLGNIKIVRKALKHSNNNGREYIKYACERAKKLVVDRGKKRWQVNAP